MAVLEILTHPDPRLRQVARPVPTVDADVRRLVDDMVDTMYEAMGVGLAAPQVGVSLRVLVMDVGRREGETLEPDLHVLINPMVVEADGEILWREGCLSVPGVSAEVERAARVVVEALDREGRPLRLEATGLKAVCIQHEIDHLDGKLYVDRLGDLERKLVLQRYAEAGDDAAEQRA